MSGSGDVITVEEFRAEAIAFLDGHATPKPAVQVFEWGRGSDDVGMFDEKPRRRGRRPRWRRRGVGRVRPRLRMDLRARGVRWPRADRRPRAGVRLPRVAATSPPPWACSASVWAWWRRRSWRTRPRGADLYLRDLYRGDMVACQLFSEPGSGSDLASLPTRASATATSGSSRARRSGPRRPTLSDIGEVLCRTDPDLPKHKGLTRFVVDMRAPGVEIRPRRQITGARASTRSSSTRCGSPTHIAWATSTRDGGWP